MWIYITWRLKMISINSSLRNMSESAHSTSTSNGEIIHLGIAMFRRSLNQALVFLQILNVVCVDKQVIIQNTFFWLLYRGQICKMLNVDLAQSRLV